MTEEFQESIREWVSIDNQIRDLSQKARELRERRQSLSSTIMSIGEREGYGDATINITDGKLKLANVRTIGGLTLKYVEQCLKECIDDHQQVEKLMEYIKENRPVKEGRDIKRFVDKNTEEE